MKYKIVRYYSDYKKGKKVIKRGLTLDEAQDHCRRKDTQKEGDWFDGYTSDDK